MDMDGILYHGSKVLPGAINFLAAVSHFPVIFITNNPIRSAEEVVGNLRQMGFENIQTRQIVTSAMVTAEWLQQQKKAFRYFAVGAGALHHYLQQAGGIADEDNADFVVVGEGAGLDYSSLTTGINLIKKQGATLLVTNPDSCVDSYSQGQHQLLPGGGALAASFEQASGQKALVMGKPEPRLFQMALERLNVPVNQCLMIGDRPDTDILGAQQAGICTALVRSGQFLSGQAWPEYIDKPDFDCNSLNELQLKLKL